VVGRADPHHREHRGPRARGARRVAVEDDQARHLPQEPRQRRIVTSLKEGIDKEVAKKIGKIVRDEGPKGAKTQIQGDEIRISSKSRDDLQEVIALLKSKQDELDVALQFQNYR
jgi:uncharacterized protein YajQ (UPF0234 family)